MKFESKQKLRIVKHKVRHVYFVVETCPFSSPPTNENGKNDVSVSRIFIIGYENHGNENQNDEQPKYIL